MVTVKKAELFRISCPNRELSTMCWRQQNRVRENNQLLLGFTNRGSRDERTAGVDELTLYISLEITLSKQRNLRS